jgi:hypothetical protein
LSVLFTEAANACGKQEKTERAPFSQSSSRVPRACLCKQFKQNIPSHQKKMAQKRCVCACVFRGIIPPASSWSSCLGDRCTHRYQSTRGRPRLDCRVQSRGPSRLQSRVVTLPPRALRSRRCSGSPGCEFKIFKCGFSFNIMNSLSLAWLGKISILIAACSNHQYAQ